MEMEYRNVIYAMIGEVNKKLEETYKCLLTEKITLGISFNNDSQSYYYTALRVLNNMLSYIFIEEINLDDELKDDLTTTLSYSEEIMKIYEKNKDFFDNLDRNTLVIQALRKKYDDVFHRAMPDKLLLKFFPAYKEMNIDDYYSTEFFKNIGYLEYNYHFEIYNVIRLINKSYRGENPENVIINRNLFYYNTKPIFTMKLIESLHKKVVYENKVFEDIDEYTFFREINFLVAINKLKLIKGNNNEFYYIVYELSEVIQDSSKRDVWLANILGDFDIKESTFKSKYRHIAGSNATESQEKLKADIDEVFKLYGA